MSTITTLASVNTMIKSLKKALKASNDDPFLYEEKEIRYMKTKLRELRAEKQELNSGNGFG
jgi:hypothetical protein